MSSSISDERFYFLWLREILGVGSNRVLEILECFETPKAVYETDDADLLKSRLFTQEDISKKSKINSKKLLDILDYCDQNNIRVVTFFSAEYPQCLKYIEAPPLVLFVRGMPLTEIFPTFGIVGSRKATEFGKKAAFSLSAKLSLAGFTIVSGGAQGIDKMAHLGAMATGNKTVVILGSGIDSNYLKSNQKLRKAAEINGAVVSEFLPKSPAAKYTFPIRNRLISAFSSGVAVIEAGQKSGALITASYAMEQGKEVFTLPGDINREEYKGNNQLIKEGAIPITDTLDVLSVYSGRFGDILNSNVTLTKKVTAVLYSELEKENSVSRKSGKAKNTKKKAEEKPQTINAEKKINFSLKEDINCSDNAKKIISSFNRKIEMSDILSAKSGISGAEFIAAITELELKGYIKAVPIGRYRLNI